MNSIPKYSLDQENSIYRQDKGCDCQHPVGKKVIFESNYSNFGPLDVTFAEGTLNQTFNQPIASVTIDSTCLECKNILIDFTGILNVTTTTAATSTLSFTLFKICDGMRARQPVTTFNFFVADLTGGLTASHTLVFKFPCENNECNDCCTYILELGSVSNLDFGTVSYSINGTFSALAIGSAC